MVRTAGDRLGVNAQRALWALAVGAAVAVAWVRLPGLVRTHAVSQQGLSNVEAARRWLYVHAANRWPIAYGYEKNYLLPRAYSFGSYPDAAALSRTFIFYREDFQSLHELFRRRLYSHEFAEFSSMTAVPHLRLSVAGATMAGSGQMPKVCAGSRCYPPREVACTPEAESQLDGCVAYSWDMDRPSLRHNLSIMALQLPRTVTDFAVCWYDCEMVGAEAPVHRAHDGRVPLLQIADHLFASSRVLRLTEIRKLESPGRIYVVTTPKAYRSWLPKAMLDDKRGASAVFAELIDARLIRYFDAGSGPSIEIYLKEGRSAR